MSDERPPITPAMRVGDLLDLYPELEDVLIELAEPFRRLKNPVLRKTVARLTTLQKAAVVANVPLGRLMRTLREAAGQAPDDFGVDDPEVATVTPASELPAWLRDARIVETIDADAMLERGEHPIGRIQTLLAALQTGEVVCLSASFRPEPLLQLVQQKGFEIHTDPGAQGKTHYYIGRP
ncbi:MAG: DUF1858 domain-containing protein [Phycisphaerales bacterium]|nr:DUF1858 domain-containing protein [Phycisphaerales bacterium]